MTEERARRYARIAEQLRELVPGKSPSLVAAMATTCALLHAKMPHHLWTGFYVVAGDDELHVGPYQGALACQVLKGRGACLRAVQMRAPIVVPDVAVFPGHVACDPRAKSEIVIPVVHGGRAVAVLDIDSDKLAQFTDSDISPLAEIVSLLLPLCEGSTAA